MTEPRAGSPAAGAGATAATDQVASPARSSAGRRAEATRPDLLPVAPLAAAIEARGGLRACGVRYDPGDDAAVVRRVERLARAYLRARNRGYIGLYDADELAVDALGLHPAVVYADAWWDALERPTERPVRAAAAATA